MRYETRPMMAEAFRVVAVGPPDPAAEARRAAVLARIQRGERRTAQIDVSGTIDAITAGVVGRRLAAARDATHILLTIDSNGGLLNDAVKIFKNLRQHGAVIRTLAFANCCSAATIVFSAGDIRTASPETRFQLHRSAIAPSPHIAARGTAEEYRRLAASVEEADRLVLGILLDRTGASLDELRRELATEASMNAGDACRLGLAHEISGLMKLDTAWPEKVAAFKASRAPSIIGTPSVKFSPKHIEACRVARFR